MRMNLFKLLILGFVTLPSFSLPVAYAQEPQYLTVVIQNNSRLITYVLNSYKQSDNCFFSGEPNQVSPQGSVSFTGDLYPSLENCMIQFTLQDPKNRDCVDDPQQQLGHCYNVQVTYNENGPAPSVTISDNSQPCSIGCTIEYNTTSNINDVKVTITPPVPSGK